MENQDPDVGAEPVLFVLKRANEESRSVRAKADEEKEIVRRRFSWTLLTQKTEVILAKLNGLRSRARVSAVPETLQRSVEAPNEKASNRLQPLENGRS